MTKTYQEAVNHLAGLAVESAFRDKMTGGWGRPVPTSSGVKMISFVYQVPEKEVDSLFEKQYASKMQDLDWNRDAALAGTFDFYKF